MYPTNGQSLPAFIAPFFFFIFDELQVVGSAIRRAISTRRTRNSTVDNQPPMRRNTVPVHMTYISLNRHTLSNPTLRCERKQVNRRSILHVIPQTLQASSRFIKATPSSSNNHTAASYARTPRRTIRGEVY